MSLLRIVLFLVSLPSEAVALTQATIQGRVHDEVTGEPIPHARVGIVGLGPLFETDGAGHYRLERVPAGSVSVRVEMDRYTPLVQNLDIDSGATVILPLELSPTAVVLDRLGIQAPMSERASGVTKGLVRGDQVNTSGADRTAAAATARVPGARVLFTGGAVGIATRILLRGLKGMTLPGDPLYYLDGLLVAPPTSASARSGPGEPSILDLIDPASIDRIEVLSGPAASAAFGLGSNNGVILIYTKH